MISARALAGLGIAAVLAVFAAVASQPADTGPSAAAEDEPVLPELDRQTLEAVDGLEVTAAGSGATLERRESGWHVAELDGYPADRARLERALVQLSELVKKEPKTAEESFYGRLDLQDPSQSDSSGLKATVLQGGETVAALIKGKSYEPGFGGTPGVYVRRPDGERAWLAAGALDTLSAQPTTWVDTQIVDIQSGTLAEVALSGGPRETPLVFRRGEEEGAQLQPAGDLEVANRSPLETAATVVATLEFQDVQARDNLAAGSGDVAARYVTQEGLTVTLDHRTVEGEHWITLAAEAGEGASDSAAERAQTLNQRWQGWAYRISPDAAEGLLVTRQQLQQEAES